MHRLLDMHSYDRADQLDFAELSGDFNPLHLDRGAARREFYGDIVVHGMHGLLRALDAWCAGRAHPVQLTRIKASFPSPIFLDVPVQTFETERGEGRARLAAEAGGGASLHAQLEWREAPAPLAVEPPAAPRERQQDPDPLDFEALPGRRGELPLWLDRTAAAKRFPAALAVLPPLQIAQLCAVTRLVGMHCPGLRSVLLGAQLAFDAPEVVRPASLAYRVERALRRASLVQLGVSGAGLSGSVDTLYRPAPQAQPELDAVRRKVREREFAQQIALVVGGSRGLGEVTAKLIAAGGGRVVLTYQRGRADAERVADSIRASAQGCDVLQFDAQSPDDLANGLREIDVAPTHLYYFASPKIFVKRGGGFDAELFERFRAAYVTGFEAACRACRERGRPLHAFYPSSSALEESVKNLEEYVAAKRAGEEKCAELARSDPDLTILVRRLPRIATDQTASFVQHPAADALEVMTDLVRGMNAPRGAQR